MLTLGLAIGINSTIFSILHGVLLRPLAYAEPDRLIGIWESNPSQGIDRAQVSAATYLDWRERTRSFIAIGLSRYRGYTLAGATEPERLVTVDVSPVLFRVLGVAPLLGCTFTDDEERPGSDSRKVILRHGAWVRRFAQNPNVLGQTITLDDRTHTIVGVMPREFHYPATDPDVELWSPLTINLGALASRPHRMYQAMARLTPGTTVKQARGELAAVSVTIAREHPDSNSGWSATLVPGARAGRWQDRRHAVGAVCRGGPRPSHRMRQHCQSEAGARPARLRDSRCVPRSAPAVGRSCVDR